MIERVDHNPKDLHISWASTRWQVECEKFRDRQLV